ncbi:DUF1490 family protein [Rhodococcus sp. 06-1474-1B]|uniref:DUF1490 family protein n=1 Tax=Rhodococcus sp. 06-1474-1B TaxID=2022499 RepID=UPI003F90A3EE
MPSASLPTTARRSSGQDPTSQGCCLRHRGQPQGARKVEVHAESARLAVSDVVAESRDRLGEEVPPPVISETGHGHSHSASTIAPTCRR